MIGFKIVLMAACAALSLTAAPAAVAHATETVSGNEVIVESEQGSEVDPEEEIVQDAQEEVVEDVVESEENDQQNDLLGEDYEVSDSDIVTVSDNNISTGEESELQSDIESSANDQVYPVMPLADYETYYGTISTTYVEYFRGYLGKLQPGEHYVAARTGQYQYIFAYGAGLAYDGAFSGDDVMVIRFNTQNNGSFEAGIETTFSLDPGSYMVYSDLSDRYPGLETSGDISLRQIVFVAALIVVFYTASQFMHSGIVRSHSRRWKR